MTDPHNPPGLRERLDGLPISRVLADHPGAEPVLYRHLGASCFDCPGRFEETLDLGIRLHEADPDSFYEDLEKAICID